MPSPTVRLLWESGDAEALLRERVGGTAAQVARAARGALAEGWDRTGEVAEIVVSGPCLILTVEGDEGRAYLKAHPAADHDRMARIRAVTLALDPALPVSRPIPGLDGAPQRRAQVTGTPLTLSLDTEVPGEPLDGSRVDQAVAAAEVLHGLHSGLAGADTAGLPPRRFGPLDAEPVLAAVTGARRAELARALELAAAHEAPHQPVHGDYRAGNILCVGGAVAGVIDLDEMEVASPWRELGHSAALLGTRFHGWRPLPAAVEAAYLDRYLDLAAPCDRDLARVVSHAWAAATCARMLDTPHGRGPWQDAVERHVDAAAAAWHGR